MPLKTKNPIPLSSVQTLPPSDVASNMAVIPERRMFWDSDTMQEYEVISSVKDLESLNLDELTPHEFMSRIPAGCSVDTAIAMLFHLIKGLNTKVKALENELTDRIILDKGHDKP